MGMYTTMILDLNLKKETPCELIEIIEFLCTGLVNKFETHVNLGDFKDHTFFKCSRWADVGAVYQDHSLYGDWGFDGKSSRLTKNKDGSYRLKSISVIKDYENELENFLDLIQEYVVRDREVYGWFTYEEWYTISEIVESSDKNGFEFRNTDLEDIDEIEKGPSEW